MAFNPEESDNWLSSVRTKQDFLEFLDWMATDFWEDAESWQNRDLDEFLRGLRSWLEDFDEGNEEFFPENGTNWSKLAKLLYAGKIYE